MVAKRQKRRKFATEAEAAEAALAVVPVTDEDPAEFWGPDWEEKLRRAEEDVAAGRVRRFMNEEEMFAFLESLDRR